MECERRGYVLLDHDGHIHHKRTVCKTWRCRSCKLSLLNYVSMVVQYGVLMSERSWLTTVTYSAPQGFVPRDAACVRRDSRLLKQRLRVIFPSLVWFEVPELTERGQVHLHLIMSGIKWSKSCRRKQDKSYRTWSQMTCRTALTCGEHLISRLWEAITHDSYVVDSSPVRSAGGVGHYVADYLKKGLGDHLALEALGFKRRYSTSRNWPRGVKMRMRGTEEGVWSRVTRIPQDNLAKMDAVADEVRRVIPCRMDEQIGTPLGEQMRRRRILHGELQKVERLLGWQ